MTGRHRILPPVPASEFPRMFLLNRMIDHSGQSGLGTVALGTVFSDGLTVLRWRGHYTGIHQIEIYNSTDHMLTVHGHHGGTELIWLTRDTINRMP